MDYCLWIHQSAILPLSSCHLFLTKLPQDAWSRGQDEPVGPLGFPASKQPIRLMWDMCTLIPHALSLGRPMGEGGDRGELRAAWWKLRQLLDWKEQRCLWWRELKDEEDNSNWNIHAKQTRVCYYPMCRADCVREFFAILCDSALLFILGNRYSGVFYYFKFLFAYL